MATDDAPTPLTGTKPASGVPARGYSWETFKPGNMAAVKTGAYSPRIIEPLTDTVYADLTGQHPRLRNPLYAIMVRDFARTLVRVELLEERLAGGDLDAEGNPLPGSASLLRYRKHLMNLADRLGLTPLANAKLGKDTTDTEVNLARIAAQLAQMEANDDGDS